MVTQYCFILLINVKSMGTYKKVEPKTKVDQNKKKTWFRFREASLNIHKVSLPSHWLLADILYINNLVHICSTSVSFRTNLTGIHSITWISWSFVRRFIINVHLLVGGLSTGWFTFYLNNYIKHHQRKINKINNFRYIIEADTYIWVYIGKYVGVI